MRLGVQMLDSFAQLNSFQKKETVELAQGETVDLYFQLIDKDQSGLRYVPAAGATVFVEIPRFSEVFPTMLNQRSTMDFSVRRFASQAFSLDSSIWKLSLAATDTANMMSSNIRVTVTEGSVVKIALLPQALKVFRSEDT